MKPRIAAYTHWVFMQTLNIGFGLLTFYGMYLMLDWDVTGWIKVPIFMVVFVVALLLYARLVKPIWDKNDALMERLKQGG